MEKYFALYDSDVIYATRFMEYYKKKKDFNIEIVAFTREESLKEFLVLHQIEILLIGCQITLDEVPVDNIKYIYRFSEDSRKEKESEYPLIFQYQSAEAVMTEVISDYIRKENEGQQSSEARLTSVLSIYAPIPSVENLSYTWSISTLLSEQKKVLLVLLDLLPIQLLSFIDNSNQSLSEFIYYLKENPNIIIKMKSLLNYSNNLSYLTGITHGADILSLNKEDMIKWVNALSTQTDYQRVVFYLGGYSEAMIELMKLSNSVLITTTGKPYENAVLKEWKLQMERIGMPANQDKFKQIKLQEERLLGQVPISLQELAQSLAWADAQQFINSY